MLQCHVMDWQALSEVLVCSCLSGRLCMSWCSMSMCFPSFPIVSSCIPIVLVLHRTASKCLSVSVFVPGNRKTRFLCFQAGPAERHQGATSSALICGRVRDLRILRTKMDNVATYGYTSAQARTPWAVTVLCAEVWAANFVEGHQDAARSSDLLP